MHIDTAHSVQNGKKYTRHLLRESYRENGKVKHRTIANLSHCSDEEIAAMKLALKHKKDLSVLKATSEIELIKGSRVGAVFCLHTIANRLGLTDILGKHRHGKLALWQIYARLIDQGSRLSAVRLANSHAAYEILGLEDFNEDHLYDNLAWLSKQQETIEKRLFKKRYSESAPGLFLYDVTSSYLEGDQNELAAFGYNRDGKKGKKQIVIGLLTAADGSPVAVRVFEGNTLDFNTIPEQIKTLAMQFGVKNVTIVGDRGMIKSKQIDLIGKHDFHYISAITKPQIRSLISKGVIQLGLFDDKLCEVMDGSDRYILRKNPVRQEEIYLNREKKLQSLRKFAEEKTKYLSEHPKAKPETSLKNIQERCKKYGLSEFIKAEIKDRVIVLIVDDEAKNNVAALDGCYILKTDLTVEAADMQAIHSRYKDLALVEKAFRTWKTGSLELRPIYVRSQKSTKGHVFVIMLAYLIERELAKYWQEIDITVAEGVDMLSALCGMIIKGDITNVQTIPEPDELCGKLLDAADISLPKVLPLRNTEVATRQTLTKIRKKRKKSDS